MRTILLLLTLTCSVAHGQHLIIQGIMDGMALDSMLTYVEEMSGEVSVDLGSGPVVINSRHSDHAGNALAQQYYEQKLAAFGYTTEAQAFNATGRNILARKLGSVHPEEIVVLCAHYDAMPPGGLYNAPAADDDGSGCAALLEAARVLHDIPFERTIVFALWDQEEQGKIGSIYYANNMAANDENIVGVVNMDAIAYDGNGDKKARVHARPVANSMAIADTVFAILDRYEIDIDLLLTNPGATYSDHASFWSAGYGAVLMIEEFGGDGNPYYHTPNDRIQHFDVPYFEKMAKLSVASMAALAMPFDPSATVSESGVAGVELLAYPNPTTGRTQVRVRVNEGGRERITVMNAVGQEVLLLLDAVLPPGEQRIDLDLTGLAPGAYTVKAVTPEGSFSAIRVLRTP
ncbi:MAG: M20/M25/M40 family metallo-hydrolase [Flavobacteriales bacterium]|nr:M20/M25/M40 family metallo-hydrolase [Flavobacteriales bacterium]MCB9178236.1 M20/M25/M40 family metallo-hydrolase [Flavobacteriales bacterium]HPF89618.1 M20/M25/M40 family metallo-hydrolase [Flavobacteriales bacterium]